MDYFKKLLAELPDLNVLYVEDEPFSREMVSLMLKNFFKNLDIAQNGQEALEKFKQKNYDIVITDMNMPKLNGFELAREIRKLNKETSIIFLSGSNDTDSLLKSINLGIDGYLVKPINLEQFIQVLTRVLQKHYYMKKAKESENYLKQFQKAVDNFTIISKTNPKGVITYTNKNFEKISKYSKEELLGKFHNIVRHPDMPKKFFENLWKTIKIKKPFKGVIKNRDKEGKSYYVDTIITPVLDLKGNVKEYLAVRKDITLFMNPKKMFFDTLNANKNSILIYMKLDNYDELEDFYTKNVLDKIEEKSLTLLHKKFMEYFDFDMVYNLENGEFALLLDKKYLNDKFIDLLQNIQKQIKQSVLEIDEDIQYDLNVLMSVVYDGENIYESARIGLKEIIKTKKMFIIANNYSVKHHEKAKENLKTIHLIKKAVVNSKVVNFYQAIINNKTKEVDKYESLVRIIDENGKVISPYFFLDISKKSNYYPYITKAVLNNSFNMLKKTDKEISINLSFLDIENDLIKHKIFNLLKEYKEFASRIVFEILEDEEIENFDLMVEFINEVKKYGVKIAIDDFGSGYSNYIRLLDYQPDILKIDGSLIKNIDKDEFSRSIIKSIVTFAKEQNLKTVAEFVENKEIAEVVKELEIDYSQGYYYSKPEAM